MKKFFLSITYILLFNATSIHTLIVQSYAITDVYRYLNQTLKPEDILIVLDIDNTIAESTNQLASSQWFTAMHKIKEQYGMTLMEAVHATLPLFSLLAEKCTLQPVESTTVALIKDLQNKKHKVIALTVRAPKLKTCTINHLNAIDIDFTRNPIYQKDIFFNHNIQYIQGILFIDGGNKGEWLLDILKQIDYMPKQIIFVDDKEYNHYNVEGTLTQNGIDHTCIWYRYCDAKVDSFDLAMTQTALLNLCQQYPLIRDAYQQWLSPFSSYNDMLLCATLRPTI